MDITEKIKKKEFGNTISNLNAVKLAKHQVELSDIIVNRLDIVIDLLSIIAKEDVIEVKKKWYQFL